ncbi:MAG: 50S ribosomal protein L10 [Planctomycetota bacterium]
MSKPVKNMLTDTYASRFDGLEGAVLVNLQGLDALTNNDMRTELGGKQIKVTVIRNALAKRAFEGTKLEGLSEYLAGPNAMVYPVGDDASVVSVARELIDWAKKFETIEFRGAVLDGIQFGPDQIKALSEYPTKEEAQANVVTLLLSPARNLAGVLGSPASTIAGILKTVQERLEAGETLAKQSA